MSWTLSTSGAAITKAGLYANSTIVASGAALQKWSYEAEATLAVITRKDWVTDYSGLAANTKAILDDTISSMIAKRIIAYDMSGYTSLAEASTIIDVYHDEITRNIEVLREQKYQEKM